MSFRCVTLYRFLCFFNIHYVASMIVWETAKHFAYLSFWENLICFIYVYQKFMYMFNKGQVFLPACKIEIVLHRAMYVKQYNRDSGNLLAATSTPAIFDHFNIFTRFFLWKTQFKIILSLKKESNITQQLKQNNENVHDIRLVSKK